ncbi:MAG TPA: tetratricopeptide repeat protein, partial [Ktedonobacteraceae bacterium]
MTWAGQAEPLDTKVLPIRKRQAGPEDPLHAQSLNSLAHLYYIRGLYLQAEELVQQALAIYQHVSGHDHPGIAQSLHNLAGLYRVRGLYEKAAPLYQDARHIDEQVPGYKYPDTAQNLYDWARLFDEQGHYEQAELLYQQALQIRSEAPGRQQNALQPGQTLSRSAQVCTGRTAVSTGPADTFRDARQPAFFIAWHSSTTSGSRTNTESLYTQTPRSMNQFWAHLVPAHWPAWSRWQSVTFGKPDTRWPSRAMPTLVVSPKLVSYKTTVRLIALALPTRDQFLQVACG